LRAVGFMANFLADKKRKRQEFFLYFLLE